MNKIQKWKDSISMKLTDELIQIDSLSQNLQILLEEMHNSNFISSHQKETQSLLESRIVQFKSKINEANSNIKATQNETINIDGKIEEVKQAINNTNNTINELALESFLKENRLQQLINKVAESKWAKTPFKKNKSKSALKGGRSNNYKGISEKTPSTVDSFNHK